MKKMALAAMISLASQAFAGPFGFSQGMSIEDANKLGQFAPGEREYTYVAKEVTSGHADFQTYSILLTPKQGVCSVVAVGKDMYTNAYGHQLKNKFRELTSALAEKYGYPQVSFDVSRTFDFSKNFDFWNLDGMWIEDTAWMDGLLNKTRTVSATWEEFNQINVSSESIITPNLSLPDSLSLIRLNALARSANRGYMRIEYRFSNYGACVEAVNSKKNSNL